MKYLAANILPVQGNTKIQKKKEMETKQKKTQKPICHMPYILQPLQQKVNKSSKQQGYKLWLTTCMLIQSMMHTLGNLVAPVPHPTSDGNNYYYQLVTMVAIALQSLVV